MRSIPGVASHVFVSRDNNPPGYDVSLMVKVEDSALRRVLPGFDGLEKAFALLPQPDGHWRRVDLKYNGTSGTELGPHTDFHTHYVDSPFFSDAEVDAVRRSGVAFGLETNVGTVWLQDPGDNAKPEH